MSTFRERVQAIQTELSAIADEVTTIQSQGPGTPFTGTNPTGPPVFTPDTPTPPYTSPPPAIGWWRPLNVRTSFPALAAGDYAGAQDYAANGYLPNGTVALNADRLEGARKQSDALGRCNTAEDANRIVAGAGGPGVEQDAVIYACMIGRVDTSGLQNPQYNYKYRAIAEWVDYLQTPLPGVMAGQREQGPSGGQP